MNATAKTSNSTNKPVGAGLTLDAILTQNIGVSIPKHVFSSSQPTSSISTFNFQTGTTMGSPEIGKIFETF